MTLKELKEARSTALDDIGAIEALAKAEDRDFTEIENETVDAHLENIEAYDEAIAGSELQGMRKDRIAEARKTANVVSKPQAAQASSIAAGAHLPAKSALEEYYASPEFGELFVLDDVRIPSNQFRPGNISNFAGRDRHEKEKAAYTYGMFCLAAMGHGGGKAFCAAHGIPLQTKQYDKKDIFFATPHKESVNISSGYLVPPEIDSSMIDLRDRFGVARKLFRNVPMTSDTKDRRRRTGGLTSYFVGEGAIGTHSTKTYDMVNLTARKLMVLSTYSNELNEDAIISIGDDLAGEISYAFASKEDDCAISGDGTATYGNMTGIKTKLANASLAGVRQAAASTDDTWSLFTLADFHEVIGYLPEFAETPNVTWLCSKPFFAEVMEKLMIAAGGNVVGNLAAGAPREFLGYPVMTTPKMPKVGTTGTEEIVCVLGDFTLAADFGDRRETTIAFSTDATVDSISTFEYDEVAIRGSERFDINVHSVGSTTAGDVGPIVGLMSQDT